MASMNPWIFINLATMSKVAVTDTSSVTSSAWDLALKRSVLYTNDGDGGPGQGGAVLLQKPFDQVTDSDVNGAAFATESLFDSQCNPKVQQSGSASSTFSNWYDYDQTTHVLTPAAGAWLLRGGTGKLYKLAIGSYYATSTGGMGTAGGYYLLKVGAL
jgi:hypothetical protein